MAAHASKTVMIIVLRLVSEKYGYDHFAPDVSHPLPEAQAPQLLISNYSTISPGLE